VDRSTTDDAVDPYGSSDLAVADLPSTSGAHWANRDQDMLYRRSAARPAPFRRPPAVNSFPGDNGDGSPQAATMHEADQMRDAVQMPGTAQGPDAPDGGWFRDGDGYGDHNGYTYAEADPYGQAEQYPQGNAYGEANTGDWAAVERPEPEYGPAPPATPGRASFGVTAGPISPSGRLPAAPTSPAHSAAAAAQSGDFETGEFGIGDIGTGGHEIRPHRASRHDPPAHDPGDHGGSNQHQGHGQPRSAPLGEAPRRSRTVMVATVGLALIVLLGGAAAGVMFYSGSGNGNSDKTITAPLDGRTTASFELVAATTKVTVKAQDLGDELYKITSMDDTAPTAVISTNRVQLHLNANGTNADGQVQVLLSSKVRWALRFVGGADEQLVDLTGGKVSALEVLGGSRRLQLALPKPTGTVPISVTGSVEDLSITSPKDSPVRVHVDSGAKTVAAGDRTLRDVKAGSTLTPKGWNVANRYDVDAAARVTLLSVTVPK
jgi:hypothetical protein